jgi:fructosamine-3-kinase
MSGPADRAARLLNGVVRRAENLAGGDLSQVMRIFLQDGRTAVVKGGPAPRVEARMLQAISASGAPAPAILAVDDSILVLEALPGGGRLEDAWGSLGAALARLHCARGPRYGWAEDYAFGDVTISNCFADDWPQFWAERRLLVHVAHLPAGLARRVAALARDMANRLPARPPPALLHGDCWGGNALVSAGQVSGLIDPACYFGHGEVDIAMLGLFDHPGAAFFDAYGATPPADRLAIYRLWPALVHVRLFGSGYLALVDRMLTASGI